MKSLSVLLFCVVIIKVFATTEISNPESEKKICDLLLNENENILAIGELKEKFLLITDKFKVAFVEKAHLNSGEHILDLQESKYETIEDAIPAFNIDTKFQGLKNQIFSPFIHTFKESKTTNPTEIIVMPTLVSNQTHLPKQLGVVYVFGEKILRNGWQVNKPENIHNVMGVFGKDYLYGLSRENDAVCIVLYNYKNSSDFTTPLKLRIFLFLCEHGKDGFFFQNIKCKKHLQWGDMKGFAFEGTTYLFDSSKFIIIGKEAIDYLSNFENLPTLIKSKIFRYQTKSYRTFIKCSPDRNTPTSDNNTSTGTDKSITRAQSKKRSSKLLPICLLLILLIVCCVPLIIYLIIRLRKGSQSGLETVSNENPLIGSQIEQSPKYITKIDGFQSDEIDAQIMANEEATNVQETKVENTPPPLAKGSNLKTQVELTPNPDGKKSQLNRLNSKPEVNRNPSVDSKKSQRKSRNSKLEVNLNSKVERKKSQRTSRNSKLDVKKSAEKRKKSKRSLDSKVDGKKSQRSRKKSKQKQDSTRELKKSKGKSKKKSQKMSK